MAVASVSETVTVTAQSPDVNAATRRAIQMEPPSQNVVNLQARAAGVLPIRVDVPARRRLAPVHQAARRGAGSDGEVAIQDATDWPC
jgi:hypothetical protein